MLHNVAKFGRTARSRDKAELEDVQQKLERRVGSLQDRLEKHEKNIDARVYTP